LNLSQGITLKAPTILFPVIATVRPKLLDWSVNDSAFGLGRFTIQLNTFDSLGAIYQNVILVSGNIIDNSVVIVSPDSKDSLTVFTRHAIGSLFRTLNDQVELSFAETDGVLKGGQANVYINNKPVLSTAFLFPPDRQPLFQEVGFALMGFGGGSKATFSNASFDIWIGEEGSPSPLVLGGGSSGETNNLAAEVTSSSWMGSGYAAAGDFISS
jgi:hypothetical protein